MVLKNFMSDCILNKGGKSMIIEQKPKTYKEPDSMIDMPKNYKRPTENLPDMKKVKAYYERLQKK